MSQKNLFGKSVKHQTLPYCPVDSRVSRSVLPGSKEAKKMTATSGQKCLELVSELRPSWVIGENVAGFINLALSEVLINLESIKYEARAFVLPAAGVGAWHKRERCFIVAHSNDNRRNSGVNNCENRPIHDSKIGELKKGGKDRAEWVDRSGKDGPVLPPLHSHHKSANRHAPYLHRKRMEHMG